MNRKKSKAWKIVGIILLVFLVIVGGISIWFSSNYKNVLKRKLPVWVAEATDSLYKVSFEDITISLIDRDATIKGLKLWVDSSRIGTVRKTRVADTVFNIQVPLVEVENILWNDIIADKEVICGTIRIHEPKVQVLISAIGDTLAFRVPRPHKRPRIKHLHADEIRVYEPDVYCNYRDSGRNLHFYAKGGQMAMTDWEFELEGPEMEGRFFYAKRAEMTIDSFLHKRDNGRYHFRANSISFSTAEQSFSCKDLTIKSPYDKQEFFKVVGRQADMFDIHFGGVTVQGVDWEQILDSNKLIVEEVVLDKPHAEDYFTRLAPANTKSKLGNFPNQLLLKLPIAVYIPVIRLKDGFVKYTEVNQQSRLPGSVAFDHTTGTIENATNMPEYIAKDGDCRIKLHSNFNGASDLTSLYVFSLRDSSGAFFAESKLKDLAAWQIKSMAKALMLVSIDSLNLSSLHFKVKGDENYAQGTATIVYENLKVSLIQPEPKDGEIELNRKEVTSWIANAAFVHKRNPSIGEPVKVSSDRVQRDPYKSFFNLLWAPVYSSIINTIIRGDAIEEAIKERHNAGEKKSFFRMIFGGKKKKDKK